MCPLQFNPNQPINMKLVVELGKIAVRSAGESAITGGACSVALAAASTIICWNNKEELRKIDGKSFGPYSGQTSKSLKSWKAKKAKTKVGRAAKKFFSPVSEAGVKYCEGVEKGMRYLYSNSDMLKPAKAILCVK